MRVPHPSSVWVGPLGRKKFQKSAQWRLFNSVYYYNPTNLGSVPSLRKSPAQAELGRGTLVSKNESDALARATRPPLTPYVDVIEMVMVGAVPVHPVYVTVIV
jgi:hypothetical protein